LFITFICAGIQVGIAFVYQLLTETALSGDMQQLLLVSVLALAYIPLDSLADFFPRLFRTRLVHSIMNNYRIKLAKKVERINGYDMMMSDKNIYTTKLTNEFNVMENEFLKPFFSLF